jgi:YYY domain-containing protein
MAYAQRISSGIGVSGYPPAEHWANRPAIVTPFLSIVLWGMGLLLGLAAFGGLLWAAYRVFRGVDWQKHVILVLFTGGMFLFLGTRWVMEMRYFLVLYPLFCLLAAWALMELRTLTAQRGRIWRGLANILVAVVPLATLVWAWTFTGIYRNENSRLQASRWVFQNFPSAFSLEVSLDTGEEYVQGIPFYGQTIGAEPLRMNFTSNRDGRVETLSLGHVRDLAGAAGAKMHASLSSESSGTEPLAEAEFAVPPPGSDSRGPGVTVPLGPVDLKRGERYSLAVKAVGGGEFSVEGATFVYEDWDDPIPQNIDGFDANLMFDRTSIRTIPIMWPDVEDKRTMFVETLAQADYIIIPSQRRIWSVCRMPAVYPLTMEYYRALFDGRLGFELSAVFQSPLTIGPLRISDLAGAVSWGRAPELPVFNLNPLASEESFSVYDHAPVWIFRKRADFSIDQVKDVLYAVDITHAVKQDANQSFGVLNGLMLPEDRLDEQRSGGTWSEMFSYEWIWNRYPGIAVFLWWLWALVTGWAALPLISKIFRGLPDEGYSIAKISGWLLVTWAAWILGSVRIPFVWTTIALVWLVLAAAGGILGWRDRARLKESFRKLWKTWLAMEVVFLCFFLFDLLIRLGNSDLWHPSKGGEKPMDFSYLNAVIKSTSFPAYDPWFSGGYLNYYHFGFVLVAIPVKLLGTVPSIAYNIALPLLFGTIGVTAYGVAWNLAESLRRKGAAKVMPWVAGLSAAVMLVVLGNLGEVKLVWDGLVAMSTLSFPHGTLFGLGDLPHVLYGGLRCLLGQAHWPFGIDTFYWNASRAIPVPISAVTGQPLETGPITEFPFFTFLYADLHAHMTAMPMIILSLAGPAAMVIDPERLRSWKKAVPLVAFTALAVGSLWATNSWNYPVSLTIALIGLGLAGWRMLANGTGLKDWRGWIRILLLGGLMAGLSVWLFQPYYQWYAAGYTAFQQWKGSKTPLDAYFMIHGLFLFILITYLVRQTREWLISVPLGEVKKYPELGSILLTSAALLIAGLAVILAMGYPVIALAVPLIIWAAILGLRKGLADEHRVVLGLLAASLAITCLAEIIVLKGDLDRMNTVFKFYIQAWLFFSVAAGIALGWLAGELGKWKATLSRIWLGALGLLVAGCLLYTGLGSYYKIVDRMSASAPRTLDGMTYMEYSAYYDGATQELALNMDLSRDYRAIRWIQENVRGSPVIVEAHNVEYRWGSRFTINTGLPGVLGWNWHQRQQRGVAGDQWVWDREREINSFYSTTDLPEARAFLRKYDVKYIIVGQLERAYYPAEGLQKFDAMAETGELRVAYRDGDTTIYEVVRLQT